MDKNYEITGITRRVKINDDFTISIPFDMTYALNTDEGRLFVAIEDFVCEWDEDLCASISEPFGSPMGIVIKDGYKISSDDPDFIIDYSIPEHAQAMDEMALSLANNDANNICLLKAKPNLRVYKIKKDYALSFFDDNRFRVFIATNRGYYVGQIWCDGQNDEPDSTIDELLKSIKK